MPTLIIDADACPVTREALACARAARARVDRGQLTQDIGFTSMVLGRGAAVIGMRGNAYSKATIDTQLFIRHEEKKVRRAGGRTRGPSAFTDDGRERFKSTLARLLREALEQR